MTIRYLVSMLALTLVAAMAPAAPAVAASLAADVIVVVDTSGGTAAEVIELQSELNSFAATVAAAGIDLHLVMIAAASSAVGGICVPAPLGSGNCANDENLPGYRHVPQAVGSTDALSKILDTYPQWQGSLRSGASKDFLVLTDDDSNLSAADFNTQLLALDPSFAGYRFSGIVASFSGGATDPCVFDSIPPFDPPIASASGDQYVSLINQTGGGLINLCNANGIFGAGLQGIAAGIDGGLVGGGTAPEPGALALLSLGLVALAVTRRRRMA